MHLPADKFILLDCTDSTNNYAMRLIRKGDGQDGTAIFTQDQQSGKGRLGRIWHSEPGSNLIMSIITSMNDVSIRHQFNLSMIAAITVANLIEIRSKLKVFVKWPNDIFINDRKAGGILIENIIYGQNWQWAVTGFGINVNQNSFGDYQNATSLSIESGQFFEPLQLAADLRTAFVKNVHKWKSENLSFFEEYNNRLYKKDEMVNFQSGETFFSARIKGITPAGKLITEDKEMREWMMDEVRMILA